jgi:tetratricopeptide (TPR) repeat protein
MKWYAIVLTFLGLMLVNNTLIAQDKEYKKAENLYKNYQYNAAIPYYEAYLELEKRKKVLSVKTKLAYCYRMANKSSQAEELYAKIIENPKARPQTFFYYGEMLMANGKYNEAKVYFKKYLELKPEDEKTKNLIAACDKVKFIKPQLIGVELNSLSINTSADDFSPVFYDDGIAFLSDQGEKGSTYGWTGRSYLKLYKTLGGGNGDFQEIESFSRRINEKGKNTGPVTVAQNGETMIITRNSYEASKKNTFNLQLFELKRKGDTWSRGIPLSFCKIDRNYMHPTLSSTGDTLFFVSDKAGGQGGTDIFMSYRTPKGWKNPINLGETVNTSGHEAFPFIHPDGTLYFSSKGHSGFGGFDIFKATLKDGVYSNVTNLGTPINSPKDDTGFIMSNNKKEGYFASARKQGNDDIYHFAISTIAMKGGDELLTFKSGEKVRSRGLKNNLTEKSVLDKKTITLECKIVDGTTQTPLKNVTFSLKDENGRKLKSLKVSETGVVNIELEKNKNYSIVMEKTGYRSKSSYITTNATTKKLSPTFGLIRK